MAYKGKYKVINTQKYKGDYRNVIFRSLWEYKVMKWCDFNKNVIWWSSEPFPIKYLSPIDGKFHNYWIDFIVKLKNRDGEIETYLIEVKPDHETRPPKTPKRKTKSYYNRIKTYQVNQAKWKYAQKICEQKNWKFKILTEKNTNF